MKTLVGRARATRVRERPRRGDAGAELRGDDINERANFASGGAAPVDSHEFGMSPYGCRHMAGNVAEWCVNEQPEGFTATGGSWESPPYVFSRYGALPSFYVSDKHGFRCVVTLAGASGNDQGAMRVRPEDDVPEYERTTAAEFAAILRFYATTRRRSTRRSSTTETDEWRREKIAFNGAGDDAPSPTSICRSTSRGPYM